MGENNSSKDLYKDIKTDSVTENISGEQTIQTEETKTLNKETGKKNTEVLIGKDINDVNNVKEDFDSLQRKLLNKLS